MKKAVFCALAVAGLMVLTQQAHAAEPRLLGTYSEWSAYVFMEDGNKVCYMASKPTKAEGNYTRRGDTFALITHRPADNTKNVFSYIAGYQYKPGSETTLKLDSTNFKLFTQDETAWAQDPETDNKIATALRRGSSMSVKGTSSRGTPTEDSFSLKGSSAAHDAISRECGIQ